MGYDFRAPARQAIIDMISVVDSSVTTVFTATRANRVDWRNLLVQAEQGGSDALQTPWVVLIWGKENRVDFGGSNDTYAIPIRIYHVYSTKDLTSTTSEMAEFDALANGYRTALRTSSYPFTVVGGSVEVDDSHENPANSIFLEGKYPLVAIEVTFEIITGATP